jgi:pyruvate/2-oxoglutarate dehydrogenase complex dihydrolipoamide acyltransferase (E2) component
MIYQLRVPGPIEDVDEIRVLEWHHQPGAAIARDDLIVELETHKAVVEVRAGQESFLREILCAEGEWRRVGDSLALLTDMIEEPIAYEGEALTALAVNFEVT